MNPVNTGLNPLFLGHPAQRGEPGARLGILVINIYFYAMPLVVYHNPLLLGGSRGINYATWIFTHLLFEQKMMAIFAMLFGGGIILISRRAEERAYPLTGIYYRRMLWLLVIGLAHSYLLWVGDILYHYAVCGMALYPLRRLRAGGH